MFIDLVGCMIFLGLRLHIVLSTKFLNSYAFLRDCAVVECKVFSWFEVLSAKFLDSYAILSDHAVECLFFFLVLRLRIFRLLDSRFICNFE